MIDEIHFLGALGRMTNAASLHESSRSRLILLASVVDVSWPCLTVLLPGPPMSMSLLSPPTR